MTGKLHLRLFRYIQLEFNMILRNKKPLNNLYQILLIYIFSILVYIYTCNNPLKNSLVFSMIVSIMSSSFIMGHGIFLLTWESTYFCFLMTRKISIQSFFRAKLLMFILSAILFSLINIPIILIAGGNFFMYISFLMFNVGIIPIFLVSISFYNSERASLDRGIFFNYEGYGMWQYLVFIFELMLPGIIYIGISRIWTIFGALLTEFIMGILGMIFFILSPSLFFCKRKYQIILGFNQK
jgi:hypothetical protein